MEDRENLQRLDDLVGKLLNAYNDLQEKNKNLTDELQASQLEVAQLQEKVAGLQDEKTHVYERVSGILGVVEQWEQTHGNAGAAVEPEEVVSEENRQKEVESSSQLFSMGS
jgi:FtsZ-binding cell division protein ZapB